MSVFVVVYLVVGCGAAAALVRRRRAAVAEVVVMVVLWPFLVPVVFFVSTPPASDRAGRLAAIAAELDEAWRHVDLSGAEVMRAYVRRLQTAEARRAEVARAAHDARPNLLERLAPIEARATVEVDDGLALLEETLAQLTVLRFVRTDDDEASRARVEDVLAQMEAMVEVAVP